MMNEDARSYLPAAGRDWGLPLYDPLLKLAGGDRARSTLIDRAVLEPSQRVLDVGCGTGTLLVQLHRRHPGLELAGIDPDPKALDRARRKLDRAGVSARLDRGFGDRLPYDDGSFDRVFSTFMLHHLHGDEKVKTLREIGRVLRSGGSLHLLDFEIARSRRSLLGHSPHLRDSTTEAVIGAMTEAGLVRARRVDRGALLFAPIAYFEALAPAR